MDRVKQKLDDNFEIEIFACDDVYELCLNSERELSYDESTLAFPTLVQLETLSIKLSKYVKSEKLKRRM